MKSWRQRYFEDFEAEKVYTEGRKGYKIVYTYVGKWVRWRADAEALKRRKVVCGVAVALITALFALCGTCRTPVNASALVAVPGIAAVTALLYAWIGAVEFILSKEKMHERDGRHIKRMLDTATGALAACFALCTLLGAWLLLRAGAEARTILVVLGYAACFALALMLHRAHKRLDFEEIEDEAVVLDEMPYE